MRDDFIQNAFKVFPGTAGIGEPVDFHFRMVFADIFRKVASARPGNAGDKNL